MKTNFIFFTIIITAAFYGCGSDVPGGGQKNRLAELEQRIQNDSLMMADFEAQFEEIDSAITQVMSFTNEAYSMNRRSFGSRIGDIDKIMKEKIAEIERLQKEVSNSNSSSKTVSILKRSLDDKQKIIQQQIEEVERLKQRIAQLEGENEILVTKTTELTASNEQKDVTISNMNTEIVKAQQVLAEMDRQIKSKEEELKRLSKNIMGQYYTSADALVEQARVASKPKLKESLVCDAMELYCKAHKSGGYEAIQYIDALKKDSKLGKIALGCEQCN